jgi:hypothetical protein
MKLNANPNDLRSCRNQFVDWVQQTGWFDCGLVMEFQVELIFHFPTWFSYFWGEIPQAELNNFIAFPSEF